ncbi:MAG: hypothetical protein ACRC92_01160 [Peptostreptococcaceae bacterium]|uniref:hypothetical protein n=1 Tax=uncultured Cetobacterium sp. TaxID=527638 RepID=UPI0025D7BB52|nr:hypothetical protein [uncultured Cetobacterium sp.]
MQNKISCILNKYEKIILEYLLEYFYSSKKKDLKLAFYMFKSDLNMIPDLTSYLTSLASKKIEYMKNESEVYYFDIIEKYSIVNNYLNINFSDEVYGLLKNENTIFQVYSLIFRNKYSLKFLDKLLDEETIVLNDQELREFLNIGDGYSRIYDLENKIIKPTIEEIRSYLNIGIYFSKENQDNNSVRYIFSVDNSNKKSIDTFKNSYSNIVNILKNKVD